VDYAQQQRRPTKHLVGIALVALMHVLLVWALVSGLARTVIEKINAPIETKIIEEVKPPPPPPENLPPPPKTLPPPPSFVPPPEVVIQPPPTPAPSITVTQQVPPPAAPVMIAPVAPEAPPAPPVVAAVRLAAVPAIGNVAACAPKGDDYPPQAQREEATGTTRIRFTVDENGKLAKADVSRSAGSSRAHKLLDRKAVEKLSECVFRPGRDENGKPAGGSFDVEYVWKLE
jgi:periplasmic protein TonB